MPTTVGEKTLSVGREPFTVGWWVNRCTVRIARPRPAVLLGLEDVSLYLAACHECRIGQTEIDQFLQGLPILTEMLGLAPHRFFP